MGDSTVTAVVLSQDGERRLMARRREESDGVSIYSQTYEGRGEWATDPEYGCSLSQSETDALALFLSAETMAEVARLQSIIMRASSLLDGVADVDIAKSVLDESGVWNDTQGEEPDNG